MDLDGNMPYLTLLILTPLAGALLIAVLGAAGAEDRLVKVLAAVWSLIPIALALAIWSGFDASAVVDGQGAVQFIEKLPWIDAIKVDYFLGVDGISLPLVILTTVMTPVAML